jgi:Putative auto-transporter adhesin, head GIN domain
MDDKLEGIAMIRWHAPVSLIAAAAALVACSVTTGSGNVVSESRNVSGFTKIDLTGAGEVTIDQNGTEALTIEADDNLMPKVTSEVVEGTLRLGERSNLISLTKPVKYRVSVKDLTGLMISGSGTVTAAKITSSRLAVDINGSGRVTAGGTVENQDLMISGSGDYQAKDLQTKITTVKISGSGDAAVSVSDSLDIQMSGSGKLTYYGNPPQVTQQISGSGRVSKG